MNSSSIRSPTQSTVWRRNAFDSAAKSSIRTFEDGRSAVAVGTAEKTVHVSFDRVFQPGKATVIAGPPQPTDVALRKILVTAADRFRHVDIGDVRRGAERAIGREHQILEAACEAGADVEQTADRRRRQQ